MNMYYTLITSKLADVIDPKEVAFNNKCYNITYFAEIQITMCIYYKHTINYYKTMSK